MSSTTPNIEHGPITSHPTQPKRFPIRPAELASPTDHVIGERAPSDLPHVPPKLRSNLKQPKKMSSPLAGHLVPEAASVSKNPPDNNIPIPRTSRAHLLAGLRAAPKVHSGFTSAPDHKQIQPNVPQVFNRTRHRRLERDLRLPTAFDFPVGLPYGLNHSVVSPQHVSPRPIEQRPGPAVDIPAAIDLAERRHLAALSVQPQTGDQQNYGGEQYPHVQVQQFPQVQQNVVPQQRQQQQFTPQVHDASFWYRPVSLDVDAVSAVVDKWRTDTNPCDTNQDQTEGVSEAWDARSGSSVMSARPPQISYPSQGSAAPARLSEPSMERTSETPLHERLAADTINLTKSDESHAPNTGGNADSNNHAGKKALPASEPVKDMPSATKATQSEPHTATTIFAEARGDLKRLQADIADLSHCSDESLESSGSDSETQVLSGQYNEHTTNNGREETGAGGSVLHGFCANTANQASTSGSSPAHKRSQLDENNEDCARAEIGISRKRTKLSSLRFICCFHNGPGRKCCGTDDTISEVLKKLAEQHDTHVCDRCWVLKIKDDSSGLYMHPSGNQACLDHCLSPQCHKKSPAACYRHLFDQSTCGTKTSRIRPGNSEAVYRFIFRLVHPELDPPSSVLTAEHSLHLDAVPRQNRRKPNREELTARANDLEKRLEAGEQQNLAYAARIMDLEQQLANAHLATKTAEEKNASLEKQSRRIITMLKDALRMGRFPDQSGHASLLERVAEDAPGALIKQSKPLPTPSSSDRSRNSSTAAVRADVAGLDQLSDSQPAMHEDFTCFTPLPPLGDQTADGYMSGLWPNDLHMDHGYLDVFDEPGGNEFVVPQP